MLDPSDFVHLPYTTDLTQAGILYAFRSLAIGLVRASNLRLDPLRSLSADVAADLSLRRYLAQQHIKFKTIEAGPFSKPERSEILLGGRPCHIINTLITHKSYLRRIAENPAVLMPAPACVPEAALTSEKWGYQDLLIFVFTLAMPKLARQVLSNAQTGGDPDYLIFIFPESWRNARVGGIISHLIIQNESDDEITLEVGGRAANQEFFSNNLQLPPHQPSTLDEGLTSLAYFASRQAIASQVSVYNPILNRTLSITHDRWSNLWINGLGILLAGYIEVGEFRRRARRIHSSNHPWERVGLSSQSPCLPIQELQSLPQFVAWLHLIQESS